jgi:diguanylate cyclase (GGDEF)-like protein
MDASLQRALERWGWGRLALVLSAVSAVVIMLLGGMAARAVGAGAVVPAVTLIAVAVLGLKLTVTLRLAGTLLAAQHRLEAEIGQRARAERQLQELVQRDEVTRLANRRVVGEAGARMIAQARRHDRPVAVMMLDLDAFKQINDRLGHIVGDEVLEGVARRLESAVRSADLLARFGGDEFVVLMPDTDGAGALAAAQRLQEAVRYAPSLHGVTVSVGIAVARGTEAALDTLLSQADAMLLRAKSGGRDGIVIADQAQEQLGSQGSA